MSEFVKKTMMGYREVLGSYDDPECTHVILTMDEYTKLLRKITDAEQKIKSTKYEAERKIKDAKRDADCEVRQSVEKANQMAQSWNEALEIERAESRHLRNLNENLLRITKERANADRKLKPKKDHTGYSVVFSTEKEYRHGKGNMVKCMLWETVIQSPYSVEFPEEVVRKQVMDELTQVNGVGDALISEIGIDGFFSGSYAELLQKQKEMQRNELLGKNIMLKPYFRANFRAGYWEAVFFHTKPLGIVPADMRAR